MARRREMAMIEPEPWEDEHERGIFARLVRLIFGVILGLAAGAWLIANPEVLTQLKGVYDELIAQVPAEYAPYTGYATIAVAVLLVYLLRGWLVNNAVFYGVIIGAALWVPFGNHMMAAVPQIDDYLPGLRPGLEEMIGTYPQLNKVQEWAELTVPVEDVPVLTAPTSDPAPGAAEPAQ
jgi:hypothetical protein